MKTGIIFQIKKILEKEGLSGLKKDITLCKGVNFPKKCKNHSCINPTREFQVIFKAKTDGS